MITRRIARPMLSSIFVVGGLDAVRDPHDKVAVAESVVDRVAGATGLEAAPADATDDSAAAGVTGVADQARGVVQDLAAGRPLPFETESYIRANGAVQVGAGLLLAIGRAPRLASAALAATLVPTTLAAHRFWEFEGDERKAQEFQFAKNLSLLGGLVLAAVDTEGRPGLAWRAKHLRNDSKAITEATRASAAAAGRAVQAEAKAVKRLAKANAKVAGHGGELGLEIAGRRARKAGKVARRHAGAAANRAGATATDLAPKVQALGHDLAQLGR